MENRNVGQEAAAACVAVKNPAGRWAAGRLSLLMLWATGMPLIGAGLALASTPLWAQIIREPEPWLVVSLVIVAGLLAGLALLPTHASSLILGWAIGPVWGVPAAVTAVMLGAWVGRVAGQRLSAADANLLLLRKPRWTLVRDALLRRGPSSTGLIALMRLSPLMPFAMTNLVLAALGAQRGSYLLGTGLGMLPRVAAVAWLGAGLAQLDLTEAGRDPNANLWLVLGLTASAILVIVTTVIARRAWQPA